MELCQVWPQIWRRKKIFCQIFSYQDFFSSSFKQSTLMFKQICWIYCQPDKISFTFPDPNFQYKLPNMLTLQQVFDRNESNLDIVLMQDLLVVLFSFFVCQFCFYHKTICFYSKWKIHKPSNSLKKKNQDQIFAVLIKAWKGAIHKIMWTMICWFYLHIKFDLPGIDKPTHEGSIELYLCSSFIANNRLNDSLFVTL